MRLIINDCNIGTRYDCGMATHVDCLLVTRAHVMSPCRFVTLHTRAALDVVRGRHRQCERSALRVPYTRESHALTLPYRVRLFLKPIRLNPALPKAPHPLSWRPYIRHDMSALS